MRRDAEQELLALCDALWDAGEEQAFFQTCRHLAGVNQRMRWRWEAVELQQPGSTEIRRQMSACHSYPMNYAECPLDNCQSPMSNLLDEVCVARPSCQAGSCQPVFMRCGCQYMCLDYTPARDCDAECPAEATAVAPPSCECLGEQCAVVSSP
jgi:hypothetical protein